MSAETPDPESIPWPSRFHVQAAEGWLSLGNVEEARKELSHLPEKWQPHPYARHVYWELLAFEKQWREALTTADNLVNEAPGYVSGWIDKAYALHELDRTQEAQACLLSIVDRFPKTPIIPYNLACYACRLGHPDEARQWLDQACKIGDAKQIKAMALQDKDLEPLWPDFQ